MALVKGSICNLDHCFTTWCSRSIFGNSLRYSHSTHKWLIPYREASHHGRLSTRPCTPPNPRPEMGTKPLPNISSAAYLWIRLILVVQPPEKLDSIPKKHQQIPLSEDEMSKICSMKNLPTPEILRDFRGGPSKITPNIPWTHPTLQAYGCSGARTGREAKDTNSP